MKNPAVKWGVYALIFSIVWTMFEHVMGYNTVDHAMGEKMRMAGAIVFWISIVIGVFAMRKANSGVQSFGQGFKAGATTAVIYSVGIAIWYALYAEVINTQYKPTLMAYTKAKLEAQHVSAEVMDAGMKEVDMVSGGSFVSYIFLICFMMIAGLVVSAIASLIAMRKNKTAA